jgi:hypothetical protein
MEEKFKTKYHALAWAAEDEKNIFVDSTGMSCRICFRFVPDAVLRQCASDGIWNIVDVKNIHEPCRKAKSEKSNHGAAKAIYQTGKGLDVMIEQIFDECDKRFESKKCTKNSQFQN